MSNRLTDSDKWKDVWFCNLSPHAKLLFIYLTDNCNNAGIYEINKKFILFYLGITEEQLIPAILELQKSYIKSNDNKRIWLKNFLKHQKKLPLNEKNNNHKSIIMILEDSLADESKFKGCEEMMSLLPLKDVKPESTTVVQHITQVLPEKATRKQPENRDKFKKPTIEDIQETMKNKDFSLWKTEAERFFNYFESNGWKVGKNSMRSWRGAVNTWIANWYERNKISVSKSKLDTVREAHESLEGVDWNKVYGQNV